MRTLRSLVNFIYLGQAEIEQDQLETFLAAAKELEIKGLSQEEEVISKTHEHTFHYKIDVGEVLNTGAEGINYEEDQNPNQIVTRNEFDSSPLDTHLKDVPDGYMCSKCDYKASTTQHMKMHTDAIHVGVRYPCDHCPYKAT